MKENLTQYDVLQVVCSFPPSASNDPVICLICNKVFDRTLDQSWSQKFRRHMLSHSGAKPYECYFCGYKSSRKDSVKRHIRLRHYSKLIDAGCAPDIPNHFVISDIEELALRGFAKNNNT